MTMSPGSMRSMAARYAFGSRGIFDYSDTVVTGTVAADTATRRPVALQVGIIAFTDTLVRLDRQLRAEADSARKADSLRAAGRNSPPAATRKKVRRPRKAR